MAIIFATKQKFMAYTIKDRLKQLAQAKGLSMRSFEEKCGLGRGNISNMSPGGSIGSDKLSKIIDTFPTVDIRWLITGKERDPSKGIPFKGDSELIGIIREQAEEIGRLKARVEELERRRGADASDAPSSAIAHAG